MKKRRSKRCVSTCDLIEGVADVVAATTPTDSCPGSISRSSLPGGGVDRGDRGDDSWQQPLEEVDGQG